MIVGYHLIWTAYGWWLPNDPRGSMSHEIRHDPFEELGEIHYGRKKVHPPGAEIRRFYAEAAQTLKHELLTFTPDEVELIAASFKEAIADLRLTCYACAIMWDHVHILIRRHRLQAPEMLEALQRASATALRDAGSRSEDHPVWGGPGWKVFLDSREDIERTVRYIEQNPIKAKKPAQSWEFVKPYDGWLPGLHPQRNQKPKS